MTYRVEVKQSQPRSVLRRKARLSMPGIAPFIQQALAELYGLVAKHGISPRDHRARSSASVRIALTRPTWCGSGEHRAAAAAAA